MTKGFLRWDGTNWVGRGGTVIGTGTDRSSLVPGTYKPNTPDVVGLIPDQPITGQIFPSTPTSTIPLTAGSYENTIFWGQVTFGNAGGTILSNCILAGMDPQSQDSLGIIQGNYKAFDSSALLRPHVTFQDCLISCAPWRVNALGRPLAPTATRETSGYSAGVHGGGVTLDRTEMTDVQDLINYTNGHPSSFCTINASWLHKTFFKKGFAGSPDADGHTHSDIFQFNRGKNITVQYSMLGGARDQASYNAAGAAAHNGGDDTYGACFMCKQEVWGTSYDTIDNILIDSNWIYGCGHGFNMVYRTDRPYLWDTCTISNNIFSNTYPPEVGRIEKSNALTPIVTGNTIEETGAAVTAHNTNYLEP